MQYSLAAIQVEAEAFEKLYQNLLQQQDLYASEILMLYKKLGRIIDDLEEHIQQYPMPNFERERSVSILRTVHMKIWEIYQDSPNFIMVTLSKLWHAIW